MTTAPQLPDNATAPPAVGIPLDRGVRPLAERFERLAAEYRDDYPGRELDAGLLQRVCWWCADKPAPAAVSAAPDGSICVEWRGAGESLVVRYSLPGGAVWAGSTGASRPYGEGYPLASAWACLRPNVRAKRGQTAPQEYEDENTVGRRLDSA